MAFPNRTFGIEIECYMPEGAISSHVAAAITSRGVPCAAQHYNHSTPTTWKIVTDGSLGDMRRGIEIVSPILRGQAGLDAAAIVMNALSDFGCTVSRACGFHVHVGAPDADVAFFRNLVKLYAAYEPIIDAFMPPSRRGNANHYCKSMVLLGDCGDRARTAQELLAMYADRYHKLNLAAFARYQTVEFRQHSGTLDAGKAQNWITLCLRMVDAAKGRGPGQPTMAPRAARRAVRQGTKVWRAGQMMLRPEGVTAEECAAAIGWNSVFMTSIARACGLTVRTERAAGQTRYFATGTVSAPAAPAAQSAPIAPVTGTFDSMMATLECEPSEAEYFRTRTAAMSGPVAWAA
jgi:hypothetical protein